MAGLRAHAASFAFAGAVAVVAVASAAGSAPFLVDPVVAQAEGRPGAGYSPASLATWAALGALAVAAYASEARRSPLLEPGPRTIPALVPLLALGPLLHALLADGAIAGPLAYFATEPLVYATIGALVLATGAAGAALDRRDRARGRDVGLLVGGLALLAASAAVAMPRMGEDAALPLGLAFAAAATGGAFALVARRAGFPALRETGTFAGAVVVAAHALDGFTTWIGVRDPFGWGVGGFSEKNPVSAVFLEISNGWPFVAVKLVLPVVVLALLRDVEETFHRRLLVLAMFVLGFGPGASNALQMALR